MRKRATIVIGRVGDRYTIKYIGGTMPATAEDIKGRLANIWGRYIDAHPDMSIVGDTDGLEDYIDDLVSGRRSGIINIRVSPAEKAEIETAAKAHGHSSVSAYLLAMHRVYGRKE
jgi:hypothetical protein